jgi:hypothetical protein
MFAMRPLRLRSLAAGIGGLLVFSAHAAAQVDLSVRRIEVTQGVQAGFTPMVGDRATYVRAQIKMEGTPSGAVLCDGLLRVRVNGQEIAGSPFFSKNGPITVKPQPDANQENDYLAFLLVAPTASNVRFEVVVNPSGPSFYPETNLLNNALESDPFSFPCRGYLEIAYAPIDYRPSGGSVPNVPDPAFIAPGMGDNFIQGIYPARDVDFHRIDAPSKLWTSSLSGSGSSLNSSLEADWQLMNPKPDVVYGFVPGGLPYNGQAVINGHASMGNTESIRFQRTAAHEIGHNHGLQHNTVTVGYFGIDVENHLALPLGLPTVKTSSLKDVMFAGLLTNEAWVSANNWTFFHGHPWLQCASLKAAPAATDTMLVMGVANRRTREVTIGSALRFEGGEPTAPVALADADYVLRAFAGSAIAYELPFRAGSSADVCESCAPADSDWIDPEAAFTIAIPALAESGAAIDRLEIAAKDGAVAAARSASAHLPVVAVLPYQPGPGGALTLAWAAHDADGDALRSFVRYSRGPGHAAPLLTDSPATTLAIDFSELPAPTADAYFEILVTDGLRTTSLRTDGVGAGPGSPSFLLGGNAPWAHIVTPDPNSQAKRGATVILHGNGYDLEDRRKEGAALVWSSSLDGFLGTGRVTGVSDLSVGTHVITLAVTDSSGATSFDTATITIVDRPLPDVPGATCQVDLGFSGPGTAALSLCGGTLATGTTATVELAGATPNAPVFLLVGLASNPTPAFGGTLVPVPVAFVLGGVADGAGGFEIQNVPGGGGPLSVYLQAAHILPASPSGYGLSNAVRADFLP